MKYNWQLSDWKSFKFDKSKLDEDLFKLSEDIGLSKGLLKGLSSQGERNVFIEIVSVETISSSAIEGEIFSRADVMSSIENNVGISNKQSRNLKANGMVNLVRLIRKDYKSKLSKDDLFKWHKLVFPTKTMIDVGAWRSSDAPMQIISGTIGKEIIHYEAPPSALVDKEMTYFINWFNETGPGGEKEIKNAAIRSAIAHLYFESIHPFEDGNGRIGRAIAEKALFQSFGYPAMMSLSSILESNKSEYYHQLKNAQQTNHIDEWIKYFISVVNNSLVQAQEIIKYTLWKVKFFDNIKDNVNERQLKALNKMLVGYNQKFEGGMTAKKYMSINKVSKATATRDLQTLQSLNILKVEGGGRSTSYQVNLKY